MSSPQRINPALQTDAMKTEIKEPPVAAGMARVRPIIWIAGALVLLGVLAALVFYTDLVVEQGAYYLQRIDSTFFIFLAAGFFAQVIDGALGMAYGVSASTFLMSFGVPPAAASASIHTAEVFTTGISGLSHLRFRNVNKKLFRSLLIPGVLGAVTGAYLLTSMQDYNYIIRPIVAVYTLALGVVIVRKAIMSRRPKTKTRNIRALAAFGGFMDSVGGGGWGPIVASTLIAKGRSPRYTIGSVNLAEFFISFSSSLAFFFTSGISYIQIIAGLVIGGALAAPMAAYLTQRLPMKRMMLFVGVVIILLSMRLIYVSIT